LRKRGLKKKLKINLAEKKRDSTFALPNAKSEKRSERRRGKRVEKTEVTGSRGEKK
jgi:hypothetical protein